MVCVFFNCTVSANKFLVNRTEVLHIFISVLAALYLDLLLIISRLFRFQILNEFLVEREAVSEVKLEVVKGATDLVHWCPCEEVALLAYAMGAWQ